MQIIRHPSTLVPNGPLLVLGRPIDSAYGTHFHALRLTWFSLGLINLGGSRGEVRGC